jgi:hypothetical protein
VIVKHANHVAKHGLAQHVTFNPAQKTVTIMVFATPRLENAVVNQDSLEKHVKLSYAQINVVTTAFVQAACASASTDGVD